eukprot:764597-Hanusia_phi.AAC.3
MVQAEHCEGYGAVPGMARRKLTGEGEQKMDEKRVGAKMAVVVAIALTAVICVGVFSRHMGTTALESTKLRADSNFDVADAILKSAGVKDKQGSIPASIAALAAQAAKEKETGRLSATVELPQIPKKIAAMAAEAKREIMIERSVDRKKKAAKEAKKLAVEKKEKAAKMEKEEEKAAKTAHATAEKTKAAKATVQDVKKITAKAKLAAKHAAATDAHGSNKLFKRIFSK